MNYTKPEIISRLSKCHDEIKNHPFRTSFEEKYIGDYKHLLYQLTEIWGDLMWRCDDFTESETHRLRMFGEWIHDYRQYLRAWNKTTFPMHHFDYYEQMLQITHIFISTGNLSSYYNLDCYFDNKGKHVKSTKYEWITEEDCGIKSDILPMYLPTSEVFITDDDVAKEYFSTTWYYKNRSQQEKDADFERWLKHTKPVLEWINGQRKSDDATYHKCMIISTSRCK